MDTIILVLLIALLAVYVIVRQLTEQAVTWRTLLLLPALAVYGCYMELQPDLAHFASTLLLISLLAGIVPGLFAGIFRGQHTKVRLDSARGRVVSKPERASSLMWLGLLILHGAVIAISYSSLDGRMMGAVLTAFVGSLLLVSILAQKFIVYLQYSRYQSALTVR